MNKKFVDGATSVIIKAHTPTTTFTTPKLLLNGENHETIANILNDPQDYALIKIPLAANKVVILPQDLVRTTAFEVEFFTETNKENVIKMRDTSEEYIPFQELNDDEDFFGMDGEDDEERWG